MAPKSLWSGLHRHRSIECSSLGNLRTPPICVTYTHWITPEMFWSLSDVWGARNYQYGSECQKSAPNLDTPPPPPPLKHDGVLSIFCAPFFPFFHVPTIPFLLNSLHFPGPHGVLRGVWRGSPHRKRRNFLKDKCSKSRDLTAIMICDSNLVRQNYLPPPRGPNFGQSRERYGRYDFPVFSNLGIYRRLGDPELDSALRRWW